VKPQALYKHCYDESALYALFHRALSFLAGTVLALDDPELRGRMISPEYWGNLV
jgi:hypothetical protein